MKNKDEILLSEIYIKQVLNEHMDPSGPEFDDPLSNRNKKIRFVGKGFDKPTKINKFKHRQKFGKPEIDSEEDYGDETESETVEKYKLTSLKSNINELGYTPEIKKLIETNPSLLDKIAVDVLRMSKKGTKLSEVIPHVEVGRGNLVFKYRDDDGREVVYTLRLIEDEDGSITSYDLI